MEKHSSDELQEITQRSNTERQALRKKEAVSADQKTPAVKTASTGQKAPTLKTAASLGIKRIPARQNQAPKSPSQNTRPEARPAARPKVRPMTIKSSGPKAQQAPKSRAPQTNAPADTEFEINQVNAPEITEPKTAEPAAAKKKPSAQKIILTIIIILAACGLLFSGYKLYTILHGYKEGSDAYKEVEQYVKPVPSPDNTKEEEEVISVDVNALKEVNEDAKGYLYCKGLLSYPVVQCYDNSYYLTHMFNGEWNSCGCLFIDCNLPEGFESRNCIIYGHNMNDGSMFASLYKYDDEEFYKTHKEFDVFTEGHHYIYKVLSLFVTPVDGFVYTYDFASDEDFVNFLYAAAGSSPYETEYGELTADRKVITMSTCLGNDDDENRFVVMLIRDREVTD